MRARSASDRDEDVRDRRRPRRARGGARLPPAFARRPRSRARRRQHRRRDLPHAARRLHGARRGGDPVARRDGVDLRPDRAPTGSKAMRWLTIGGIVAFALVAAFLLARAARPAPARRHDHRQQQRPHRAPPAPIPVAALKAAAAANPRSYAARIAYARYLMQTSSPDLARRDPGVRHGRQLDPSQPEPPTYAGWAGALLAQQVKDARTRRRARRLARTGERGRPRDRRSRLPGRVRVQGRHPVPHAGRREGRHHRVRNVPRAAPTDRTRIRELVLSAHAPRRRATKPTADEPYTKETAVAKPSPNRRPTPTRSTAPRSRPTAARS